MMFHETSLRIVCFCIDVYDFWESLGFDMLQKHGHVAPQEDFEQF